MSNIALWRIYTKEGKGAHLLHGTVNASSPEQAVEFAKAGRWKEKLHPITDESLTLIAMQ